MYTRALGLVLLFNLVGLASEPRTRETLFRAIQKGDTRAVKRLISGGLSANARDSDGTPPLMMATLFAGADCVQLLLERGADPNQANKAGATALMWAIPDLAKVKLLIAARADVNARSINLQRTPVLITASYPGSEEVLRILLSKGADIHARDKNGIHALGRATFSADIDVVRFLVENGCDVNEPGYENHETAPYARHYLPSIDYLMSKNLKINQFALITTNWHDPKLIEKWISMGADVNAVVPGLKWTPLMMAASSEQAGAPTLKLMLEKGADPNAEDGQGEKPLDWAMYRADKSRIDVLEQYGAKRGNGPRQKTFPPPEGVADPRTSLSRSAALLLPTGPAVFQQRSCVTCHNQTLPAMVAAAVRKRGISLDEDVSRKNFSQILAVSRPGAEEAMQGERPQGAALGAGYIMMALAAEQYRPDIVTAEFAHSVAGQQMPDGSWLGNGVSRPPMEDSTISTTAMAVRALTLYPIPSRKRELNETLRRAQLWLVAAQANSAEERSMRRWDLSWTGSSRRLLEDGIRQVVAEQGTDGSWSQRSGLAPDAYATGISLYALHEAGMPATAKSYRAGVAFLLRTQYQDGSWLVKTRSFPVQPYFESGYPFGPNQWISSAGAIGLLCDRQDHSQHHLHPSGLAQLEVNVDPVTGRYGACTDLSVPLNVWAVYAKTLPQATPLNLSRHVNGLHPSSLMCSARRRFSILVRRTAPLEHCLRCVATRESQAVEGRNRVAITGLK